MENPHGNDEASPLNSFVDRLFEDQMPPQSEWVNIDPFAFYEAVIAAGEPHEKQRGRIPLSIYKLDEAEELLRMIERVHAVVSGEEFKSFWSVFRVNLDVSVWMGAPWAPHVLWNGGVLFRNFHRVIGLDHVSATIAVSNAALRSFAQDVKEFFDQWEIEEEARIRQFGLLSHNGQGIFWTTEIPDSFSDVGQTLLMLSGQLIESMREVVGCCDENPLLSQCVLDATGMSRSGSCIIRVFKERAFIYPLCRVDDDYDTILELFSYPLEMVSTFDDLPQRTMSNRVPALRHWIRDASEFYADQYILSDGVADGHPELEGWLMEGLLKTTRALIGQTRRIHPIFNVNPSRPGDDPLASLPFYDDVVNLESMVLVWVAERLFVADGMPMSQQIHRILGGFAQCFEWDRVTVILPSERYTDVTEDDLFELGSEALEMRCRNILEQLATSFRLSGKDVAGYEDFMSAATSHLLRFVFYTSSSPQPEEIHQVMMNASKAFDGDIYVELPGYGFRQTYLHGDYKRERQWGNLHDYVPE